MFVISFTNFLEDSMNSIDSKSAKYNYQGVLNRCGPLVLNDYLCFADGTPFVSNQIRVLGTSYTYVRQD